MLKTSLAVTVGKVSAQLIHWLHLGSGTSLPGKVALKLDHQLLETLGHQITQKTVAITGTNGKSTTSGLLSAFIQADGYRVVHNRLGSNMVPGITAALLQESSISGRLNADYGVIEVDEASLPGLAKQLKPDLTVVTNLFRDQLDRYGELDTTAKLITRGIEVSGGALALNADDPMVTHIGQYFPAERVYYYGVDTVNYPVNMPDHFSPETLAVGFPREVTDCPVCQSALVYRKILYGHLGHYQCSNCDFARPKPHVSLSQVTIEATHSELSLNWGEKQLPALTLNLPGLFNAYNVLAAAMAGYWLGLSETKFHQSIAAYHSIFGRAEKTQIAGKWVLMMLIKNPMGATEVLKVVTADPKARVLILINDNYADGRDISWLWDAPFEWLACIKSPIFVSGHRAEDMALRLQYAGIRKDLIKTEPQTIKAFKTAVEQTPSDETLYVLPTYTALLELSQHMGTR